MRNAVLAACMATGRRIEYPESMSSVLEDTSIVSRNEGWLSAWVGEEHVMMSSETGTCISLAETGGRIWELIEKPISLGHLCEALADEYDASQASLRSDVVAFLVSMQEQHAVMIG